MSKPHRQPHAAHACNSEEVGAAQMVPDTQRPSALLDPVTDGDRELLESLDDAIFETLQGSSNSLERATTLWQQAVDTIEWELLEESREQYLRFAMEVSQGFHAGMPSTPTRMLSALEIITLLTSS